MRPTTPPADLEPRYYWLGALRKTIAIEFGGQTAHLKPGRGLGVIVAYATCEEAIADGNPDPPRVDAVTRKDPEPATEKPRRKRAAKRSTSK